MLVERRCRYLSFVFANVVARNKGQGTSTSRPFGQQGRDREQISYASGCRLSTAGDWTSEKLGRVLQLLPDNTQQQHPVAKTGLFLGVEALEEGSDAPQFSSCDKPLSPEVAPVLGTTLQDEGGGGTTK